MCKLYALQTTMTRDYAKKVISEKAKIILKTESHGLGFALNVNGKTRSWQCGESFSDAIGEDVTMDLTNELQMATLIMHGRTSTSQDKSVNHSHPRPTKYGPLVHNGVVFPRSKDGWKMDYALDTDYLGELANRDELDRVADYLNGYAGVMLLKDDGTLIVQNQGANLYLKLEHDTIEFGTTQMLCPGGNKFELMHSESTACSFWSYPIEEISGRDKKFDAITNIGVEPNKEEKDDGQKKEQGPAGGTQSNKSSSQSGRTRKEIGKNPKKKGKQKQKESLVDSDFYGSGEDEGIPEYMKELTEGMSEEDQAAMFDAMADMRRNA